MTINDVLLSLIQGLKETGDRQTIGWHDIQQWPDQALEKLLKIGIIKPIKAAQSLECPGCENQCVMPIDHLKSGENKSERAFIICNNPEQQGHIGRIPIPLEHLQQWKITALQLAKAVGTLLGINCKEQDRHGLKNIRIGMLKSKSGRHWLSLNKSPLKFEINNHSLLVEEVLFFENDELCLDSLRIHLLADKPTTSKNGQYTPSTNIRELGKRKTAALHQDWNDAYINLRRQYPDATSHSDTWIAKQIAKKDIAQGRSVETIRKNMK